jgi:hypothetical protein
MPQRVKIGVHFLGRSRPRRRFFALSHRPGGGVLLFVQTLDGKSAQAIEGEDLADYLSTAEAEAVAHGPDEGFSDFNGFLDAAQAAWERLTRAAALPTIAKE